MPMRVPGIARRSCHGSSPQGSRRVSSWYWRSGGRMRTSPAPPLRLSAEFGAGAPLAQLNVQFGDAATLSPDGSMIAFVAQRGEAGASQLFVRRLNQLQAVALSVTEGALAPFFSPDGQWIGFFAGPKLKKIAVTGGLAVTLADAPSSRGGTWSEDGTIVFTPNQVPGTRLERVSSDGGDAQPLTTLAAGELTQGGPRCWPAEQRCCTRARMQQAR